VLVKDGAGDFSIGAHATRRAGTGGADQ
jgi:hypothetical protein